MPLEGCSERSKHPTTRNRFFVPNARRNGRRSRQLEQLRRGHGESRRNCLHPIARGLSLAAFRSQYRAYDTPSRSGVRSVPPLSAFPSVPALGSAGSATGCPALFVGFTATMAECDFSRPFIAGYGSSPSRHGPARRRSRPAGHEISRFPKYRELTHMPGSPTTPDQSDARGDAPRLFCLPQRRQRRHPE